MNDKILYETLKEMIILARGFKEYGFTEEQINNYFETNNYPKYYQYIKALENTI